MPGAAKPKPKAKRAAKSSAKKSATKSATTTSPKSAKAPAPMKFGARKDLGAPVEGFFAIPSAAVRGWLRLAAARARA